MSEFIDTGFRPSLDKHVRKHYEERRIPKKLGMENIGVPGPTLNDKKVAYWLSAPNKLGEAGVLAVAAHQQGGINSDSLWYVGWFPQEALIQAQSEAHVCVEAAEYIVSSPKTGLIALLHIIGEVERS